MATPSSQVGVLTGDDLVMAKASLLAANAATLRAFDEIEAGTITVEATQEVTEALRLLLAVHRAMEAAAVDQLLGGNR